MSDELLAGVFSFLVVAGAIWGIVRHYRHRDVAARVWRVAAERLSGRYSESAGGIFSTSAMSIVAKVDEVTVTVDHYTVSRGKSAVTITRIRAKAPGAGTLVLRVGKEGLLSTLGKALGAQDIQVGVPAFDERYLVKGSDEDLVRAWLDEEARAAIANGEPYLFVLEGGEVRAERDGLEDSVAKLADTVRAVSVVASAGGRILGRWEAVARELEGTVSARDGAFGVDGGVMTLVDRGPVQVLVDVQRGLVPGESRAMCLWTRLRARHAGTAEHRLAVVTDVGRRLLEDEDGLAELAPPGGDSRGLACLATDPEWGAGRLTPELWGRLVELAPTAVEVDLAEVTVLLSGLVLDARRTAAAVALVADLAMGSAAGPYR